MALLLSLYSIEIENHLDVYSSHIVRASRVPKSHSLFAYLIPVSLQLLLLSVYFPLPFTASLSFIARSIRSLQSPGLPSLLLIRSIIVVR